MFTGEIPEPEKVDTFSSEADLDELDWASMDGNTRISLQEDTIFEENGIAFVSEEYDHSYQFSSTCSFRDVRKMQDDVDAVERHGADANGIVERSDETYDKYTLESRIQAVAHIVLTDGIKHGDPTGDDVEIEYKEHENGDWYVMLVRW